MIFWEHDGGQVLAKTRRQTSELRDPLWILKPRTWLLTVLFKAMKRKPAFSLLPSKALLKAK
jgi:hypothetical protein